MMVSFGTELKCFLVEMMVLQPLEMIQNGSSVNTKNTLVDELSTITHTLGAII